MSQLFRSLLLLPLAFVVLLLNTVLHTLPLFVVALLKFLLPLPGWRRATSRVLLALSESWIAVNSLMIRILLRTECEIEGLAGLDRNGWYLVLANHQSWVDIPALQATFNRRIPFMRFFLKQQLIWVPLLGLAWWALDFPFMRRYSKAQLARRPELAGRDVEATRKACAKFADSPVSIMNFVEGTRFTAAKHQHQQSPFQHLLQPKAGGTAFVLETMGSILKSIVDVTIVYPRGRPGLGDLLAGKVRRIRVHVCERPIPADLLGGDYQRDPAYRARFQAWLNELWLAKDALIGRMLASEAARP